MASWQRSTLVDNDTFGHEEELKKLKANHDELEAHVRLPQGNEHFIHMINERTQGKSHPH